MVTSADSVAGWQLVGNGIYSVAVTVPAANQQTGPVWPGYDLFYNGIEVPEAQWPASSTDPMHPNWSSMASGSSETTTGSNTNGTILDPTLPVFTPSASTTVHIWSGSDPYTAYYGIPSSSSAGSLQYTAFGNSSTSFAQPGGLYYVSGAKEFITANTWFYDSQNGVLYWEPPSGVNPNSVDVRFKQRTIVADLSNRSNITITGISFLGGGLITNSSSSSNILDTLQFTALTTYRRSAVVPSASTNEYSTGVLLEGTNNILRNSMINQSTLSGVTAFGSGHSITNNLISNVDSFGNYAAGILLANNTASNITVQNNTIFNTGRSAIYISLGSSTSTFTVANLSISENHFYNTMLLSTDGGAIYGCCGRQPTGSSIQNNWIHSEVSPTSITFPKNTTTEYPWAAFYWDNGSGGITFTNNVIWDSFPEIVVNGSSSAASSNLSITNNTDPDNTYGCSIKLFDIASASNFNVTGNQLYYNVFESKFTATGANITNNLPSSGGSSTFSTPGCSFSGCNNGGTPPPFPSNAPGAGVTPNCVKKAP